MSEPLSILGNITAEQFLTEYWQKKPLLVRNALPEITSLLVPEDIKELALEENVSARLIKQKDKDPDQWTVKSSPLTKGDFQKLPKLWTLLVQAVDHYSVDLSELWKKFHFIPQWRRDDIMVSYAPKGGSVGKHFDFYDVFLVQGYGHRRWQLGQMCDETTAFVPKQPLKLLPEMSIHFDEILAPGDLLYIPPGLSHYGVAQDDCLTYSFGFRMPNMATMLDRVSDLFADNALLKNPLRDLEREKPTAIGEITAHEIAFLKEKVLAQLRSSTDFDHALMSLMSEPKYPDNVPEVDELEANDLLELIHTGYSLSLEPASRLLYTTEDGQLRFWANAEEYCISEAFNPLLKQLADGQNLNLDDRFQDTEVLTQVAQLLSESILMIIPPMDDIE